MRAIPILLFMIVIALDTESLSLMMVQFGLILIISALFVIADRREKRKKALKSDVFLSTRR